MNKIITLRSGQFLLLLLSILLIGAGSGIMATVILWRAPLAARNWAALFEIGGMACFIVLSIWKSCDDWAARTGYVNQT
jgi:hypothetical protein